MARIDTPLLITGGGPAAVVVARLASEASVASTLIGHDGIADPDPQPPQALEAAAADALGPGLEVLRPYLVVADPPTIDPGVFEAVLRHHCIADMNVTVFDNLRLEGTLGLDAVVTDGRIRWEVTADAHIDTSAMPTDIDGAVTAAHRAVVGILGG